jgi:hypothetical protein
MGAPVRFRAFDVEYLLNCFRIGNLFATLVAMLLKIAIGNAYVQYLWLRLKQTHISMGAVDGAFQAMDNLFSLATPELRKRMSIGLVIGLVFW